MSNVKVIQKNRTFDIKSGVPVPQKISKYKVNDSYLFVAPEKASLIVTNKMGRQFLEYFKGGDTIEQVIETMKKQGITQETITSELHTFLVKLERKGFYEDSKVEVIHVTSPTLHLDLTSRCNLTCIHCLQDAGVAKPNELTTSEWLEVIDNFTSFHQSRVTISGGEAMLHPGIFDILKRAKERGLYVILFTNGTLINSKAVAEKLAQYVDKLQMSLDGATEEVNDKIRGKDCYKKVIQAAHLLEKTPIELDIAVTIMPQNVTDVEQNLEKLAKRLGPRVNLRVSTTLKEGRASEDHVFTSKDFASQKIDSIIRDMYKKRLKAMRPASKNVKVNNCGFAETLVVSSTGDLYPCNIYESRTKYGNVRHNNIEEILKQMENERNLLNVENVEMCKGCALKIICCGGCRLNNIYRNNDLFKTTCSQEFRDNLCATVVNKEENLDPMALWMGKNESN